MATLETKLAETTASIRHTTEQLNDLKKQATVDHDLLTRLETRLEEHMKTLYNRMKELMELALEAKSRSFEALSAAEAAQSAAELANGVSADAKKAIDKLQNSIDQDKVKALKDALASNNAEKTDQQKSEKEKRFEFQKLVFGLVFGVVGTVLGAILLKWIMG